MGIFKRIKSAAKSKANAAVEKAISPEKEVDMVILDLEEQRKSALKDLLGYKATAKQMEQDIERLEAKAADWESKAMVAVKKGADDIAKQCLAAKKNCLVEVQKVKADRDEAAGYAIELNRSRKKVESRLQVLKLKKSTLANQIKAARSGTGNPFGHDNSAFEKFEQASERIDEEAIEAEVQSALDGEQTATAELEVALLEAAPRVDADDALAALKAKMEVEDGTKKLGD